MNNPRGDLHNFILFWLICALFIVGCLIPTNNDIHTIAIFVAGVVALGSFEYYTNSN